MLRLALIGFIVGFATLVGCSGVTTHPTRQTTSTPSTPPTKPSHSTQTPPPAPDQPAQPTKPHAAQAPGCCQHVDTAARRTAIVRTATKLIGAHTIESRGRKIAYDCAGVTRAIFLEHGIDLYSGANDQKANGVRLIHTHIKQHGRFHQGPLVHPGDLVFFDNTWDYNGDGLVNDPLTHVGVVERQESNGTIVFISRVAGAVERYRMNIGLPNVHKTAEGRVLNDYIRRKDIGDLADTAYLTGELFAVFGTRVGL